MDPQRAQPVDLIESRRRPPSFGSFGERLGELESTEFYAYFYFACEQSIRSTADTETFRHRTTGLFRDDTALDVTMMPDGTLVSLVLSVRESFIVHPTTSSFARDIVKSFLRAVTNPGADGQLLDSLLVDLLHRTVQQERAAAYMSADDGDMSARIGDLDRGESVAFFRGERGAELELPEVRTRGFAVYVGDREQHRIQLVAANLLLQNITNESGRCFEVHVTRR